MLLFQFAKVVNSAAVFHVVACYQPALNLLQGRTLWFFAFTASLYGLLQSFCFD